MNKEERIELFERELSYIYDQNVREFAKKIIEDADDYFFTVPASSSGKYHPDFARGNGGLVRHTKAVTYFANELLRAELENKTLTRFDADLVIVAAISHDIKKQGDGSTGHTMLKEHPEYGANYVIEEYKKYSDLITKESAEYIAEKVRCHMGPWGNVKPESVIERLLFYADYVASRKEIEGLSFISNNDNSALPEETVSQPVKMTVDDYVFDFGQTRGMTIKESYDKNPGYIKWMANKEGFGNTEVQNLVREFLKII